VEKFKWLYVGSGSIANKTAGQITKGNHEVVGVVSRNNASGKALSKRFGCTYYNSIEEAIEKSEADGAYIATPHTSHIEYAVKCLERKLPVLCEKPVGVSQKDAVILSETAKKYDTYYVEAMWTWFSPVANQVKKWIDDGKIGEVKSAKLHYSFPGIMLKKNSRVKLPQTAGGALLDVGIYPITYCYNLFGYPDGITCKGLLRNGIDYGEKVNLTFGKINCKLNISLLFERESCTIYGEKGKIYLPVFHAANVAMLQSNGKKTVFSGRTDYLNEFNKVAEEIRQGKKQSEVIPFKATEDCLKIMDECRRQMKLVYPFEK